MVRSVMTTTFMTHEPLFIDTSALIALLNTRDQYHEKINRYLRQYSGGLQGVTSNLILSELVTFFSRHGDLKQVLKFQQNLLLNPNFTVVWIDASLHQAASLTLQKFSDHGLSFADACSFAIMRERGLTRALTFDDDFSRAGFVMVP